MKQTGNTADTETDIAETEADIDQHADRRDDHCLDGITLHLVADCTGNTLCSDLIFLNTKVFY